MGTRERAISRTCFRWSEQWGRKEGKGRGTTYEARKGQFEKEEIGGALVAADFAEGERAGSVAAGFAGAGLVFCLCFRIE